ncbi:RecA-superfamily ATPase [Candidatus Paraburkholderia calva]|nr:RecA-superfamily ATPase [Candidatus Paraburkholderia calva]
MSDDDAKDAIEKPIHGEGVAILDDAVALILQYTHGYPYFRQEWGKHAWDIAAGSPITKADAENASASVIAALDESFSACVSIGSLPRRKDICGRCQNWDPARIGQTILPQL